MSIFEVIRFSLRGLSANKLRSALTMLGILIGVAAVILLVAEPSLLLADEPTGNLDSANADAILTVFDELHAEGMTLAVITHDDNVSRRAQRQVRIVDGTLQW